MNLEKFASAFAAHNDIELARAESVYFNTLLSWGDEPTQIYRSGAGGFFSAAAVGMAVCLIKKQALKVMVAEGAVEKRLDVYEGKERVSWGFFDYAKHQGITLTEDYAFCYRWVKLLGKRLWVCTDGIVDHIGDFHYRGNYSLVFENLLSPLSTEQEQPEISDGDNASAAKGKANRRDRSAKTL